MKPIRQLLFAALFILSWLISLILQYRSVVKGDGCYDSRVYVTGVPSWSWWPPGSVCTWPLGDGVTGSMQPLYLTLILPLIALVWISSVVAPALHARKLDFFLTKRIHLWQVFAWLFCGLMFMVVWVAEFRHNSCEITGGSETKGLRAFSLSGLGIGCRWQLPDPDYYLTDYPATVTALIPLILLVWAFALYANRIIVRFNTGKMKV